MATLLLVVIYIAFIGLGIPDSLFGPAWPAIYTEFDIPVSFGSIITCLNSVSTIVSSMMSTKLLNKFGTAWVTAISTMMTALALLGFSLSGNFIWLIIFTIPLGLGAGAIDSGLNNYVALHYKATHMNFLHCFYGVGVTLSPYLMSVALGDNENWRLGYRLAFFIQIAITAVCMLSIPIWKKVNHEEIAESEEKSAVLSFRELVKLPGVVNVWFAFFSSVALEVTCGSWGSTFLVNTKGMSVEAAAGTVMFFYAGMAIGRFLSGVLAAKLTSWKIIFIGETTLVAALILLLLPAPPVVAGAGLFLVGLGNGPIFPNLTHLTPQNFGKEYSQSVMGTQLASSYSGAMIASLLFGVLAQNISTDIFPYYAGVFLIFMIASISVLTAVLKKNGKYGK